MYGSYQAYDNSKDQERAESRIYKYAEASETHLKRIRIRLEKEHRKLMQVKVAVLTGCMLVGALAICIVLYVHPFL